MQRRQELLDRYPEWSRYVFKSRSDARMTRRLKRKAKHVRKNPEAVLCGHGYTLAVYDFAVRNGWRLHQHRDEWVLTQPTAAPAQPCQELPARSGR